MKTVSHSHLIYIISEIFFAENYKEELSLFSDIDELYANTKHLREQGKKGPF